MRTALLVGLSVLVLSSPALAMLPSAPVFVEDWESDAPGTMLSDALRWDGSNVNYVVAAGNWARLIGNGDTTDSVWSHFFSLMNGVELQLYHVEVKGIGPGCGNRTSLCFLDGDGLAFTRWYGDSVRMLPRYGAYTGPECYLTRTDWDELDIVYNSLTGMATWYFNGDYVTSMNVGAGNYVTRVELQNQWAATEEGIPDEILLDNIQVGVAPEPSSLLALSAFAVAAIGYFKRRRA